MGKVIFLNYGNILANPKADNSNKAISIHEFLQQIELIHSIGIPVISYQNWILNKQDYKLAIVLNFKGCFENYFYTLLPVLKTYNLPATFYPLLSQIGEKGQLNWAQLKELTAAGYEIGASGVSGKRLCRLRNSTIKLEIELARRLLSKRLATEIKSFAPNAGKCNRRVLKAAFNAGYSNVIVNAKKVSPTTNGFFVKGLDMGSKKASANFEKVLVSGLLNSNSPSYLTHLKQRLSIGFGIGFIRKAGQTLFKTVQR